MRHRPQRRSICIDNALYRPLGTDPASVAAAATALLDNPRPLVPSASAVWLRPGYDTGALIDWHAALPQATEIGPLPEQAAADAWARERTLGLIEQFPVDISPEVVLVLASALATRVSWQQPFDIAPASTLGPDSAWATRLTRVLHSPEYGHRAFIATTKRAGDVIAHVAQAKSGGSGSARPGLSVVSVAAAPDVPAVDVLAAASKLAPTVDHDHPPGRRSLFDLPLGVTPLWTIREERVRTYTAGGREEHHSAVLPCWSAHSTHDLAARDLGYPAAAATVAALLGLAGFTYQLDRRPRPDTAATDSRPPRSPRSPWQAGSVPRTRRRACPGRNPATCSSDQMGGHTTRTTSPNGCST